MFDSIVLQDQQGFNLGEFVAKTTDTIIGWPSEQLFTFHQANPGSAVWIGPGTRYTPTSFLRKLGRLAATDPGDGTHLVAASKTGTVQLTRTLNATLLAQLTDLPVEAVRDILRDFLTFTEA